MKESLLLALKKQLPCCGEGHVARTLSGLEELRVTASKEVRPQSNYLQGPEFCQQPVS